MAGKNQRQGPDAPDQGRTRGARRLIAGLRISPQDAALLDAVRPFLPDTTSEGERAYRLWRRGLELSLAELASLGAALPPGITEALLANLVAQRLLLCLPLLRRTGTLALLGVHEPLPTPSRTEPSAPSAPALIDADAAAAIAGMGGNDFL